MKKILIIAIFFSLSLDKAKAQYINLSDDPILFIDQADSLLKQWGNLGDSTSDNFSAIWNDLNSENQVRVINISRTFRERKYPVNPFFIAFYSSLYEGLNGEFSDRVDINQFLQVAELVVRNSQEGKEVLRYFLTSRNLFAHAALYYSKYNVLSVPEGSSFVFEYIEPSSYIDPVIPLEVEQALLDNDPFADSGDEDEVLEDEVGDNWSDDSWDDTSWDDDSLGDENTNLDNFDDDENIDNYGALDDFDPFGVPAPATELPTIEGAFIKITNADFEFYSPYDTFEVLGVSGTYIFGSRSFIGDTAIVPISIPFGEYETEAEVTLGTFVFNTINPAISAENAILSYEDLIDGDIKGSFNFRSVKPKRSGKKYPSFRSYKSNYEYKNIGEGVKLIGGFTLIGDKINTQGQDLGRNYIEIENDEGLVLKGSSQRFFVRDTLLKSHKVELVIYQNRDSLVHPQMELSYNMSSAFLTLYWEKGHFKDRGMLDSYHQVEIIADKMTWDLSTREINFGIISGRSEVPAIVKSMNNFDDQEYLRIKGLNSFHPVQAAAYYSKKKKMDEFSFFELAEGYKIKPSVMRNAVITAAGKGYLDFNENTGLIRINDKTKHAYNSNFKKGDFDNMEWYSISPTGQNISMDLDSGDMIIRGIDKEIVSKELKVFYKPDSGIVVLKKNRDFKFDGEILAGNYSIKGKNFDFDYDAFNMNLDQIDSIRFNLSNDSTGETAQRKIMGGEVENIGGMFYLNEPNNKSGKTHLPQYPILDVLKPSYVYFDDKDILGGAYDKRLYFEIPSFTLDTLESDNPSVINVEGIFHSDGIVPDFQTTLNVNPDLTLGFNYKIPEEGFNLYNNDEAKFFDVIKMDKKGLNGKGTFKYLTSTTEAANTTFYQDSMVIQNAVVNVVGSDSLHGNYPDATCTNARGVLLASNERYIINSNKNEPVNLYNGKAKLKGAAMISKKGMFGIGDVQTGGTDSYSKNFKFSKTSFTGRNAEFSILSEDQDTSALSAINAKLFFDFQQNSATLEPEVEGEAVISMPLMAYKTSIPVGVWDFDERTFTMKKPPNVNIANSYFYSTLEDQDSLAFSGESAVYDAIASILTVKGVPGIYVADAYITPGDSTVIIDESTLIQPLANASIVMDASKDYHHLNQADVDIYSRGKFDADANYVYVNSGKDTMNILFEGLYQVPEFAEKKKTDSITYGEGFIEEDAVFFIAPKILYQGDVKLYANRPFLDFDGEIRLDLKHSDEFNDWLPFKFAGDPNDIRIELRDERELQENEPLLTTGIHVDAGESEIYYTFLSGKRMDDDPDIFRATGLLSVDAESGQFKIGQEEKLSGETNSGNLFLYNDSSSIINFEGEFNLYGYMPPEIAAHSYGKGRVNIDSGNFTFNTLTYLDFPLPGPAMAAMAKDFSESAKYVDELKEASESSYKLIYKLSQMIGQKAAESYDEQLYDEYLPLYAASGKFGKSILMSDLDLQWSKKEGALFSGDTIGLASIGKNDINGRVRGYYEIKKIYEDEIVNLFLQLTPNCWYYMSYDDGRLAAFSSNHIFNEIIASKSRSPESGNAQGEAYLASADLYEVTDFYKYYNETYLGRKLADKDVNLKVSEPEVGAEPVGGKDFVEEGGWGEEEQKEDTGWGTEEEFDDGWGSPVEEEEKKEDTSPVLGAPVNTNTEAKAIPKEEEFEDDGWGSEPVEEAVIIGAPPAKAKKEKKAKEKKEKKPKDIPVYVEETKEDDGGWGFGEEVKEEEDSGWGFSNEEEAKPAIKKEERKVEPKEEKKAAPIKEEKKIIVEEDDDGGWGFGGEDDDVEIVNDNKEKEAAERKLKEEEERKRKEDLENKRIEAEKKKKEQADRIAKEEAEKKIIVEEEDDNGGWGFGGEDDDVEIVNDNKEKEAIERKLKEEEERKKQDELKAKEEEKKKLEEARKKKEEADRIAKEEAEKKIIVEEEDDNGGWGFGGEDDDVEIVNDNKEKEAAERKLKEEEERKKQDELKAKEEEKKKLDEARKKKEEADRIAKEEADKKKAEEEEAKKKIIVVEDDDNGGWGFGGDDENVEIKKAEDETKAKAEEDKKLKEEAEKKEKEAAEKLAKEEAEKKKKEEEEKKKKEEEAKQEPAKEEEEDDWDGF